VKDLYPLFIMDWFLAGIIDSGQMKIYIKFDKNTFNYIPLDARRQKKT